MPIKNPVVLVHGFHDNSSRMRDIEKTLTASGWTVFSITMSPSSGQIGIDELADQLRLFIQENIKYDQNIDIIGFSMGGLVSRYYIQRLNGMGRVKHFITISSPHHGTLTAKLLNNKGSKQMRFNSDFIRGLNRDVDDLKQLKFTSIWTPFDLMIIPSSSSHVPFGKEFKINCLLHPWMTSNKKCISKIMEELLN